MKGPRARAVPAGRPGSGERPAAGSWARARQAGSETGPAPGRLRTPATASVTVTLAAPRAGARLGLGDRDHRDRDRHGD